MIRYDTQYQLQADLGKNAPTYSKQFGLASVCIQALLDDVATVILRISHFGPGLPQCNPVIIHLPAHPDM